MRRWITAGGAVVAAPAVALLATNAWVLATTRGRVHAGVDGVPAREHGLVPGTSRLTRTGRENRHFVARTQAAADAFHRGRVRTVVVSGGPPEVRELTDALVALGVPAAAIVGDDAGVDTLATVRWAARRGVREIVLIGQTWHVPRALFLAAALGVDAVAYAPCGGACRRLRRREWLARAKAAGQVLSGRLR